MPRTVMIIAALTIPIQAFSPAIIFDVPTTPQYLRSRPILATREDRVSGQSFISEIDENTETPSRIASSVPPLQTSQGLLDPKIIGAIQQIVGPDDPELAPFFADFSEYGPMACMHHLGTPVIATRLSALMGQVISCPRPSGRKTRASQRSVSRNHLAGWGRIYSSS